jgi:3-deoxy-manno-octulosonate cytidylyltransferase (CMP-KDO synthetase)
VKGSTAVAIIPARYASTRLPGKPLLLISGEPMVARVCQRASLARSISRVIVATDDARILEAVRAAGFEAVMTGDQHETGTDRIAEVAEQLECDLVVNVQGDEPLIAPSTIDAAVAALAADPAAVASTTSEPLASASQLLDPNVVKVATRADGRALYFSRAPIPYPRDAGALAALASRPGGPPPECRKHTGLYVYRRDFLIELSRMAPTPLERLERLEQLRILERGFDIRVVEVAERSVAVDTAEDLARARAAWDAPAPNRKEVP